MTCSCWNVRRSPQRARRCGARPSNETPSTSTAPAAGAANPLITLNSVVLPAPFGPTSPHTPFPNSTETQSSGFTPPKDTVRSRMLSIALVSVASPPTGQEPLELAGDPFGRCADRVDQPEAEDDDDEISVNPQVR